MLHTNSTGLIPDSTVDVNGMGVSGIGVGMEVGVALGASGVAAVAGAHPIAKRMMIVVISCLDEFRCIMRFPCVVLSLSTVPAKARDAAAYLPYPRRIDR
jgi:hypothetical protein